MSVIKSFNPPTTRAEAIRVVALALQDAIGDIAMVTRQEHGVQVDWDDAGADDADFTLLALSDAQLRAYGLTRGPIATDDASPGRGRKGGRGKTGTDSTGIRGEKLSSLSRRIARDRPDDDQADA